MRGARKTEAAEISGRGGIYKAKVNTRIRGGICAADETTGPRGGKHRAREDSGIKKRGKERSRSKESDKPRAEEHRKGEKRGEEGIGRRERRMTEAAEISGRGGIYSFIYRNTPSGMRTLKLQP